MTLRAYSRLASQGMAAAGLRSPTIVTCSRTTVSPGSVSSQLPPASAARSTITEPGPHRRDHLGGDQARRRPAGDERRRDDDVAGGDVLGEQLALQALRLLGELLRVAAARPRRPRAARPRGTWRRGSRPARARRGARRTRSRPRPAGARSRSPAGRPRPRRARAPWPAAPCRRRSSASGRSAAACVAATSTAR